MKHDNLEHQIDQKRLRTILQEQCIKKIVEQMMTAVSFFIRLSPQHAQTQPDESDGHICLKPGDVSSLLADLLTVALVSIGMGGGMGIGGGACCTA